MIIEKSMITKLSPPWYEYHRKVQAMFGRDPEVHIKDLDDLGDGKFSYMILVYNKEKACLLYTSDAADEL